MLKDRLKLARKHKSMTQKEVAEIIGVERATYTQYETGKIKPSIEKLEELADLLSISIDYLLGRTDDPVPYRNVDQDLDRERDLDNELEKLLKDEELAAFYDFANMDEVTKKEIINFIKFKKGQ